MRVDQRSGSISLLANRGVSPASIWLTKTLAWFGVLIFVGTVVVLLDAVIPNSQGDHTTFGQEFRILQILSKIRAPHVSDTMDITRNATSADTSLQTGTCVAYLLMTFRIGQLTACWIQRQVLTDAASFLLMFGMMPGTESCKRRGYSLWIAVIPIGLSYLLATLCTAG